MDCKEISNIIMQCLQLLRFFFFFFLGTYKHKSNSQFTDWWLSNCHSFSFLFFFYQQKIFPLILKKKKSSHLPTVSSPPYQMVATSICSMVTYMLQWTSPLFPKKKDAGNMHVYICFHHINLNSKYNHSQHLMQVSNQLAI